ncbi:hypothetical protein ACJA27_01120 [Mycoplasmopsis lipophila]|uniref:hypothetical protein n=1 Tax=Mycoplasmopsis lipophila TaxID=2117 RepID=UPI003873205F
MIYPKKYKTFYDILFKDIFPFLLSEWKITDNEYKYFNIYDLKGLISWVNSKLLNPQQKVFLIQLKHQILTKIDQFDIFMQFWDFLI